MKREIFKGVVGEIHGFESGKWRGVIKLDKHEALFETYCLTIPDDCLKKDDCVSVDGTLVTYDDLTQIMVRAYRIYIED